MKIKVLVGLLFLICTFSLKAQEKFSVDVNLKTEPTEEVNFNETNIGVFISKKINNKNEITNKTKYTNLIIKYDAGTYEDFEDLNQFNRVESKFEISHKFSETAKVNLAVTPTINFQQNAVSSDLTVLGGVQYCQQLNTNTVLSAGLERSTVFGAPKFIPTLSLFTAINNQSSILIGFPDSKISYSNNERNKFILSNSFNGSFFNLNDTLNTYPNASKISTSQMTTAFEYERNMDKNWFIDLKAGYDFDKKYALLDKDDHNLYDFNTGNGYILGIGIKYKQ